jgi:hypothetical protein
VRDRLSNDTDGQFRKKRRSSSAFDKSAATWLFRLVGQRYEHRSTIITSDKPFAVPVQSRGCSAARRPEFRLDEQAIKPGRLFKGRHFLAEVIVVSVRWYLEYKLSSRDISLLLAEREISVDHLTILRWVCRCAPEFEKKWHRYAHLIGPS